MANNKEPDNAIEDFLPLKHSFFRFLPLINYGLLFERRNFFPKSTFLSARDRRHLSHGLSREAFLPRQCQNQVLAFTKIKEWAFYINPSIGIAVLL